MTTQKQTPKLYPDPILMADEEPTEPQALEVIYQGWLINMYAHWESFGPDKAPYTIALAIRPSETLTQAAISQSYNKLPEDTRDWAGLVKAIEASLATELKPGMGAYTISPLEVLYGLWLLETSFGLKPACTLPPTAQVTEAQAEAAYQYGRSLESSDPIKGAGWVHFSQALKVQALAQAAPGGWWAVHSGHWAGAVKALETLAPVLSQAKREAEAGGEPEGGSFWVLNRVRGEAYAMGLQALESLGTLTRQASL